MRSQGSEINFNRNLIYTGQYYKDDIKMFLNN